jgi:hypothetical protein
MFVIFLSVYIYNTYIIYPWFVRCQSSINLSIIYIMYLYVYCIYLCICLSIHLSMYFLSSIYVYIYVSIYRSIHPSIHTSMHKKCNPTYPLWWVTIYQFSRHSFQIKSPKILGNPNFPRSRELSSIKFHKIKKINTHPWKSQWNT